MIIRFPQLIWALGLCSLVAGQIAVAQVETSMCEPREWSNVAAAEQGVIAEMVVQVGQKVRQGDILAKLESRDLQAAIVLARMKAESQATLRTAEAQLKLRKNHHENLLALAHDGHSNPLELAQSMAQLEQAEAELLAAREQQQQAQQEVERLLALQERRLIRSPIDGVITEIHRRVGEFVSANEPQVAMVVNLDQLRVRFYLYPEQVADLRHRDRWPVQCGQHSVTAQIDFVSPVTDPKTGLVRLEVLIDNRELSPRLRSGTGCRWLAGNPTSPGELSTRRQLPTRVAETIGGEQSPPNAGNLPTAPRKPGKE